MLLVGLGLFRRQRFDANPPPREGTGGPPDADERLEKQERRLGFIERRIDRIARRVTRLEETVKTDAIAPLDEAPAPPYPSGEGR